MSILLLLLSLFSQHTQAECSICTWPYVGNVNQRGQCVKGVGIQSDLDNTCYNYCMMWASDVITTTGYVLIKPSESSTGTNCVCKRQTSSGPLEHLTRPQNSCPASWMGPPDEQIDSWKGLREASANSYENDKMNALMSVGVPWMGAGDQVATVAQMTGHINPNDNSLFIGAGTFVLDGLHDKIAGSVMSAAFLEMKHTSKVGARHDSILTALGDTLATVLAAARSAATGDDLKKLGDDLKYAINTRSGGGSSTPTDLSPVLDALANGTEGTNALLARAQTSLDELTAAQGQNGTDLTTTNSKIDQIRTQSVINTQSINDKNQSIYDDIIAKDEQGAKDLQDYKAANAGDKASAITAGTQASADADAKAGEMATAKTGLLSALTGWGTLPTTCADGAITGANVEFDIQGFHWKTDIDELLNSPLPQKALWLIRLMMRIIGALAGIAAAMSVSKMLAGVGPASTKNPFYWEV